MKKSLCLFFAVCLCLSFCACSSSTTSTNQTPIASPSPIPTLPPMDAFVDELREELVDGRGILTYSVNEADGKVIVDCYGEKLDNIFSTVLSDYLTYSESWDAVRETTKNLAATLDNEARSRGLEVTIIVNMVSSKETQAMYYSVQNTEEVFNAMDVLPESKIVLHGPSIYKVGVDLEAGEYYILPLDKTKGVYMCVSSDSNGDDILENSYQDGPHYITVQDGQYFEVTNGRFALASEFPTYQKEVVSGEGMYLVGKDIVAGEYKLTCDVGDRGYWCIYSVSTAGRDIVSNSLFENAAYVTVSDGQYLLVSSCSGVLVK